MTPQTHNPYENLPAPGNAHSDAPEEAEETLRLIARLPAPSGLEDRVFAGVLAAPRRSRILTWPHTLGADRGWVRGAAAAAIVFVVAGGGWGIYTHVQQPQAARIVVMPPRVGQQGGFSSAGAMRTPQTLRGPLTVHPIKAQTQQATAAARQPGRSTSPRLRGVPSSTQGKLAEPSGK